MKSPKNMNTIQIQITNACPNNCSNCTRFCGWHDKPFFMDFETFKKSVDSLQQFNGLVGIMGGEPTLHPQFDRFLSYLKEKLGEDKVLSPLTIPEKDISYYRQVYWSNLKNKYGLWTSLTNTYYKNFQDINNIFGYQCINDHSNNGKHQALLLPRKELGISDEQFFKLRQECWIQNMWSASITPKGCFFCQIAASMDMLFDGPGGLPIQKGWWLRRPKDFGEQLNWCENCSACLAVPSKKANEGIDIISPQMQKILANKNGYKYRNKKYQIFTKEDYDKFEGKVNKCESTPYLIKGQKRINKNNDILYPKKVQMVNLSDLKRSQQATRYNHIKHLEFQDWALIRFKNEIKIDLNRVYNPGILYINQDYLFFNRMSKNIKPFENIEELINCFPEEKRCYVGEFKPQNQDIKFSILVPTYNVQKTVQTTIQGILNQDYKNIDVFFVDDCSTDGTLQILQKYANIDKRIKCIEINEKNSSAVITRNKLIDLSDGDYSIWVDADDEVNVNMCSFAKWLLQKKEFEIIDFPFVVNSTGEIKNYGFRDQRFNELYGEQIFDFYIMKKKNPYNLWSKIIKTQLLKKSKIPNVRIDLVDDMAFATRLYYYAESYLSVNSQRMYTYNFGNGRWGGNKSMTFQKYMRNCDGVKQAYQLNYKFLLQNCPKEKYFENLRDNSCIKVMYRDIQFLNPEDRVKAMYYYQQLFKDSQI